MKEISLVSVIVAIYKDINSLDLIINSLINQTYTGNYEIIIAEDGNDKNVKKYIEQLELKNIVHTSQIDEGWRKNKSLNNAVRKSNGDLLIFLDGDCIPYSNLIENYVKMKSDKTILCGRRVELGGDFTKKLREKELNSISLEKKYLINSYKLIKDKTRHYEEGIVLNKLLFKVKYRNKESNILGCNFAVNREDLFKINGFNEDYLWPSVGEDTDIEYRLKKTGCSMKPVRNLCNVFHLYHEEKYSLEANRKAKSLFDSIKEKEEICCKNGLKKY